MANRFAGDFNSYPEPATFVDEYGYEQRRDLIPGAEPCYVLPWAWAPDSWAHDLIDKIIEKEAASWVTLGEVTIDG